MDGDMTTSIEATRTRAASEGIHNLSFISYDGIDFPFGDASFDFVETRYALHHFPDISHRIGEVSRMLKIGGGLFISAPCPNDYDAERFVDDYMRLKKDGHIRFYTLQEWKDICSGHGLIYVSHSESSIRFQKKKNTAVEYKEVLRKHDKSVIASNALSETDSELFITERVNNVMFV